MAEIRVALLLWMVMATVAMTAEQQNRNWGDDVFEEAKEKAQRWANWAYDITKGAGFSKDDKAQDLMDKTTKDDINSDAHGTWKYASQKASETGKYAYDASKYASQKVSEAGKYAYDKGCQVAEYAYEKGWDAKNMVSDKADQAMRIGADKAGIARDTMDHGKNKAAMAYGEAEQKISLRTDTDVYDEEKDAKGKDTAREMNWDAYNDAKDMAADAYKEAKNTMSSKGRPEYEAAKESVSEAAGNIGDKMREATSEL